MTSPVIVKKELLGLIYDLNLMIQNDDLRTAVKLLHRKSSQLKKFEDASYMRMVYD
jgi:predicted metal-dependent peptidase